MNVRASLGAFAIGLALVVPPAAAQRRAPIAAAQILEAEQQLSTLGYWTGPVDGRLDGGSRQALLAFQKVEARAPTGQLTTADLEALRGASPPVPHESGPAHVEVDLGRQVLLVVDDAGVVTHVLPVSTGSGRRYNERGHQGVAITPTGRFAVIRKVRGWRVGPLGPMYYPNYFTGGYAIHGSRSVPARPASHGCVRIPMYAAKAFSEMVPAGMPVFVYD